MVAALLAAPVIVLVAMWFALGDTLTDPTPWPFVIGIVILSVIGDLVLRTVGYRTVVLPRGLTKADAMAQSRLSYQAALFRRMTIAELPMIISLALAFLTPGGYYLVLFGAALTLNLLVVHVWPSERSVDKTITSPRARRHPQPPARSPRSPTRTPLTTPIQGAARQPAQPLRVTQPNQLPRLVLTASWRQSGRK
jgi:hypothetical protein